MENRTGNFEPGDPGFNIPKQDVSIGDKADMYLSVFKYDQVKYGFCDKYGHRLAESALALKKCGSDETVVYDGIQTAEELRKLFFMSLAVALSDITPNGRGKWMAGFLNELNEVHKLAVSLSMH
jgi:hypothetical protein